MLGIDEIEKLLPHRYPFLLVDRILEIEEGKRIVGIKNVTANEPFFPGHFPGHKVMPGVLIIEALAQVGCILLLVTTGDAEKVIYFMSMDKVKFRKNVVPGDQLKLEIVVTRRRDRIWRVEGKAFVDGNVVTEGEFQAYVTDIKISELGGKNK
ncbi:MAG: 3-hydroxyacyl-[acyl-carrier-protein] dehydratase FabZ [Candidatus Schekmanbacteria bacterium RBG_16_38_11]|uniref:3-hydroxyacyl-[acyl-carrier-protein] dehydratase FabZ n=1 Tax=Candidatus Schekmanbacteria bacterium RBG_16_38_11 TaxID=1817880 RepID=A0A1F7RXW3_9BACT|nr:MAG: 3-hydroxyacyl-[acyl-carrier-protein] dehydratase FabZ [Candidatus Schekmanbacteria bacterium RBG_16_38_11]